MITTTLKNKIIEQAFRCPSVHNVQPWLIEFQPEGLTIYDDLSRTLSIGDKSLHDHEVSMGAFVEGLNLILSTEGLGVGELVDLGAQEKVFQNRKIRARFRLTFKAHQKEDSLAGAIPQRRSYRGLFKKSTDTDKATLAKAFHGESSAVITEENEIKSWAQAYDQCVVRINSNSPYQEELYQWLRLTEKHPSYSLDGLNREALSLSAVEGSVANFLMKPSVYRKLHQWGLAQAIVSEAPQIRSSTGLLFIFKRSQETAFAAGRRFYRTWLELSQLGFSACPLSSLVDDAITKLKIESTFQGRIPLNVLRVGLAPENKIYKSTRLNTTEKVIEGLSYEK
jgi:hypothetical protein